MFKNVAVNTIFVVYKALMQYNTYPTDSSNFLMSPKNFSPKYFDIPQHYLLELNTSYIGINT